MGDYSFDKKNFHFKKARPDVGAVIWTIVKYLAISVTIPVCLYVMVSLVVSTGRERTLIRENRMYEKFYPRMVARQQLLSDVIALLQEKDYSTYRDIFGSEAPEMDPNQNIENFFSTDSLRDRNYVRYISLKSDALLERSARVEENFLRVMKKCSGGAKALPPLSLPLKEVSYAQVGASTGLKNNPFYKVPVRHDGIDIIAPQGDDVLSSADGYVSSVIFSRKGLGNVVEITHAGGYVTRYCHLSDIEVRRGQRVRKGQRIGYVGISGTLFAPHLHYEVLQGGVPQNPVNYFFASVTPELYANMFYMSATTTQSLD